jgi:hypothetical protein
VCETYQTIQLNLHYTQNNEYCGVVNPKAYFDSLLWYANALWSQECIRFEVNNIDEADVEYDATNFVVSVQCSSNNASDEACAFDSTNVLMDFYNDLNNPNLAYPGLGVISLMQNFNIDNDQKTIELVILDGAIAHYDATGAVYASAFAFPSEKGNHSDNQEMVDYLSVLGNAIHAPMVFLGCAEPNERIMLLAAHELGHILTGREHQGSTLSLMHNQVGTTGLLPNLDMVDKKNALSRPVSDYQTSQVRTYELQYGATGTKEFNNDY